MPKCKGVYCRECGQKIRNINSPCPICESNHKMVSFMGNPSIVKTHTNINRIKAKRKNKLLWDYISRDEPNYFNKNSIVHKERDIRPCDNKYLEIITDKKTGEVIHYCKEPLSEHQGHGNAKKKKD